MSIPERNSYLADFWAAMTDPELTTPGVIEAEVTQAEQDFLELGLNYLDRAGAL
jgi:hypothetical protein